jgi:hypothetical protein
MNLSIESECFIQVSFHFIWHDSLENNAIKLSTETGLRDTLISNGPQILLGDEFRVSILLIPRIMGIFARPQANSGDVRFVLEQTT